jgi:hypothetical protein
MELNIRSNNINCIDQKYKWIQYRANNSVFLVSEQAQPNTVYVYKTVLLIRIRGFGIRCCF